MPQANWIILLHFAAVWLSVITSLMAGWHLPLSYSLSIPLGLMVWFLGFLVNLRLIRISAVASARTQASQVRKSYRRIFARTIMNLGISLTFRSWFTMMVSALLIPLYATAARQRRAYLDYLRTGMLSNAFPHRIRRT